MARIGGVGRILDLVAVASGTTTNRCEKKPKSKLAPSVLPRNSFPFALQDLARHWSITQDPDRCCSCCKLSARPCRTSEPPRPWCKAWHNFARRSCIFQDFARILMICALAIFVKKAWFLTLPQPAREDSISDQQRDARGIVHSAAPLVHSAGCMTGMLLNVQN